MPISYSVTQADYNLLASYAASGNYIEYYKGNTGTVYGSVLPLCSGILTRLRRSSGRVSCKPRISRHLSIS